MDRGSGDPVDRGGGARDAAGDYRVRDGVRSVPDDGRVLPMRESCRFCGVGFTCKPEQLTGTCLGCMPLLQEEVRTLSTRVAELSFTEEKLARAYDRIEELEREREAELMGHEAAARYAPRDSCPFAPASVLRECWLQGWDISNMLEEEVQVGTLLFGLLQDLDVIRQLAAGYAQDEIVDKIVRIYARFAPTIERLSKLGTSGRRPALEHLRPRDKE